MNRTFAASLVTAALCAGAAAPRDRRASPPIRSRACRFDSIGPDITTGRISDVDIDPKNPNVWYVASASGGLFKTENRGNTFARDLRRGGLVFARRGEGRSEGLERRLAGDGREQQPAQRRFRRRHLQVHRRRQDVEADGAGELRAHPEHPDRPAQLERRLRDRDRAAVAARRRPRAVQDARRRRNVEERAARSAENTGATDIVMDPKKPDTLYVAMLQRRRQVGQLIGGGPDSGIYKTTDGGAKWTKLTKGLPTVEMGRVGLGDQSEEPEHSLRARDGAERRRRVLPIGRRGRELDTNRQAGAGRRTRNRR